MTPDNALLQQLKTRESAAYDVLYRFYYPAVEKFVRRNNGTAADARDVFQETLLVLLDRVPREDFELTSSLKTYLLAISHNLWLKRLRDSRRVVADAWPGDDAVASAAAVEVPVAEVRAEQEHTSWLVRTALRRVTQGCYKLLRFLFFTAPADGDAVVWQVLGYKNRHTLDNQKYKCLEQARRSAGAAPPDAC